MIPPKIIISSAFVAITASNALILHPSPSLRRHLISLNALNNDEYDGRPSYRRYQRDNNTGESKNRFRTTNSNYNSNTNNNEDDAYELARELASRRGLNLSSRDRQEQPPNIPMGDPYENGYRDVPPMYGSDYGGISEQELPKIPMDYNANRNYNEGYGGSGLGGGGLKDLTWGGLKEQNDQRFNERFNEVRRTRSSNSSSSVGRRYKNPQPPRQPPREVRPSTDYRGSRNDRLYQSGPSSQRSQASMGRRMNNNYDEVRSRTQQQPRQPPPPPKRSNPSYGSFEEVKRVNKLSELASTSERMDGPARRPMSQFPGPNAPYRPNNIPYEQPPFRPPSTMSGFAPTAEQVGRAAGSMPPPQFMPPPQQQPPSYVQMPQYQQQQRQRQAPNNIRPPPSIPLSQLALQPHIQPVDQPSPQQQSSSFSSEFGFGQQQSQQMSGGYNDRRQQPRQQSPPPPSFSAGRNQSESFGSNPSASFSPLPFQQLSQADFTRPFQGGSSQQSQQQSTSSSSGAARQSRPEFGGGGPPPPPGFGGPPPQFDQGGPPPPPFGPDVHIFQNPFMNEPMFQQPPTPAQPKPNDENVKVPKDPNVEKMRRRAVSNSSSSNNPGSGMKIPKDPLIERRRKQQQQQQQQQSTSPSTKVPRDPFIERQRNQQQTPIARSTREEVRVPKEPTIRNQPTERRPKEPRSKSSNNNIRIPREPTMNARRDKIPKEPQRNKKSREDTTGDDMNYEDFASFFDMPKL